MTDMWTLIKHEFKTHGTQPILYLILGIMGLLQVFLTTIMIKTTDTVSIQGSYIQTVFQTNNAIFLSNSIIFIFSIGAVIGYYIISVEYQNNTWEMLLLGTGSKSKVLWAKYIVSTLYYLSYQVLFYSMFLLVQSTYFNLQIEISFSLLMLVSIMFLSLVLFTAQIACHYLIKNGTTAIACAVGFLIMLVILPSTDLFRYVIRLLTPGYLAGLDEFSVTGFVSVVALNIIVACSMMSLVVKQFKL